MHESVQQFVQQVRPDPTGKRVLEVGSRNVNGSIRPHFAGARIYYGIDVEPGDGVDGVTSVEAEAAAQRRLGLSERGFYDIIVSCEMLEHARDWQAAFRAMAELLVPGGHLLLTTRGPGFPRHNCKNEFEGDYWRFDERMLEQACAACGLLLEIIVADPQVPGVMLRAQKIPMPEALPEPGWVRT